MQQNADRQRSERTHAHSLTGLLGILLVAALIPSIYLVPVERVLFRPETYEKAVAVQEPDRKMAAALAELVTSEPEDFDPDLVRTVSHLDRTGLEALFASVLPAGWAQDQANQVIAGMLRFLNGQGEPLSMPVNFTPLKNSLDAHSQEMAVGIVTSWPACSPEILLEMGVQVLNGRLTEIPFCQPNESFRPVVDGLVNGMIRVTGSSLPHSVDLAEMVPIGENPAWWPVYRVLRVAILAAPVFALVLLLVILAINGFQSAAAVRSIGQSFFLAGLFAVILLVVLGLGLTPLLHGVLDRPSAAIPAGVSETIVKIAQVAGLRVAVSVVVWSGLATVIGLALWFGSAWVTMRERSNR